MFQRGLFISPFSQLDKNILPREEDLLHRHQTTRKKPCMR